jgi:hypothetical protein
VAELLQQHQTSIIAKIGGVLIGLFEAPYAIMKEQQSHESKLDNIVMERGSSSLAFLIPKIAKSGYIKNSIYYTLTKIISQTHDCIIFPSLKSWIS